MLLPRFRYAEQDVVVDYPALRKRVRVLMSPTKVEKLNSELPIQVANCQEKKVVFQQQWSGQSFLFQHRGSVWEDAFSHSGFG